MFYEISGEKSTVLCAKALPQTAHSSILCRTVIKELDRQSVFLSVMKDMLPSLKDKAEFLLLIPCSDYYTELVVRNRDFIEKYVQSPILSKRTYGMIRDKAAFKKTCDEYGISHPQTEISLPSVALSQKKSRTYPLVLKPANSNFTEYLHSSENGRKKAYICSGEEELIEALEHFVTVGYTSPIIIQEYIEGGEEYSRVVNAYCDRDGKVRAIGVGIPLLEYRNDREIGNYAAIKTVDDRSLCDRVADILEKIGYVGFANLDLKIRKNDSKVFFLEINPRQGRSSYYMRVAGINLMQVMYEDVVLGKKYSDRQYADGNFVWINEPVSVIKREMSKRGLKKESDLINGITALEFTYDFNIPRALTLLKRRLGAHLKEI
jgi:D-aspartate ligase